MQLVVDANIFIAALLKDATTRRLLLRDDLELYAPEHLRNEISDLLKISRIRKRLPLNDDDLYELTSSILSCIDFVPEKMILSRIKQALKLVAHEEDAPYVALSLALNIPIWSNDTPLKEAASAKIEVLTTTELLKLL